MKTFKKISPDDKVFMVYKNSHTYKPIAVAFIDKSVIELYDGLQTRIKRTDLTSYTYDGIIYFSNESAAIRYCKAQIIKVLHEKINSAKKTIQDIKDFREEYYQQLNLDWTDKQINKLEKQIQ